MTKTDLNISYFSRIPESKQHMVLPEIEEEADDPSGRRASKLLLTSLLLGKNLEIRPIWICFILLIHFIICKNKYSNKILKKIIFPLIFFLSTFTSKPHFDKKFHKINHTMILTIKFCISIIVLSLQYIKFMALKFQYLSIVTPTSLNWHESCNNHKIMFFLFF